MLRQRVLQPNDIHCVSGCGNTEIADHLFIECDIFGSIWNLVWQWLGITFVSSGGIGDHFTQIIHLVGMSRSSHSFFKVIRLACVWAIWKERNHCIFKNVASDPNALLDKVKLNSFL